MRRSQRDFYGYIPGFAVIVVVLLTIAFAPSYIPKPLRQALGLEPSRVVPARTVDTTGSYAFLAHQGGDGGSPVGYDPCRTIEVKVNPDGGPADYRAFVDEALEHIGDAAGLSFSDKGTTSERPRWDDDRVPVYLGQVRRRPVLISWADSNEVPQLEGDVAGVGGSVAVEDNSGEEHYIAGAVTLDKDVVVDLMKTPAGRREARAILLHELGHVLGLDHVDDPTEIMNPEVSATDFGPGDLAGLAQVGDTPCE